jgi:hypothetical protein
MQVVAPIVETPAPPQGSILAVIDLTVDNPPSDKGKQKADVEMADALDRPGTSAMSMDDLAEASARWPDYAGLALVRAKEELPRWGQSTLEFRDASNPSAEPFFALDDKDKVHYWEFIEGLRKHSMQSRRMVTDTLVRGMSEAFEVSWVCLSFLAFYPSFLLSSDLRFNCGQELKERSCSKSLFIHHESGVWAVLARQQALDEEANERLSKKSAEVDELRIVQAAVREEVAQAQEAKAKAPEDTAKARKEVAKVHEDLAPLLARVKELEEDVASVSGQRDALNI